MLLTTRAPAVMTTYKSDERTQAACRIDSVFIPRWDSCRRRHITNHAYVLIVKNLDRHHVKKGSWSYYSKQPIVALTAALHCASE